MEPLLVAEVMQHFFTKWKQLAKLRIVKRDGLAVVMLRRLDNKKRTHPSHSS